MAVSKIDNPEFVLPNAREHALKIISIWKDLKFMSEDNE